MRIYFVMYGFFLNYSYAGTNFDAPSKTTSRSRTLASKVRPAFHFCVFLFRRLTWTFVGKITRWSVSSNANKFWQSLMLVKYFLTKQQ